MRQVDTPSGPVEVAVSGGGMPLLVLHGTPGGSDQAQAAAQAVGVGVMSRVIAPSRPGYLGTPLSTGRTPAAQADAMVAVLDELEVGSAVVFGASGGGMAAVALAARHPSRVRGLVLWSAVTGPMRIPAGPLLHGPLAWQSTGTAIVRLVRRFPGLLVGRKRRDPAAAAVAVAIAETVFPIGPRRDGLSNDSRQARALDPELGAQVTAPTLIVHGTKDRNVAYSQATRIAAAIPHAELITVRAANHWTTMADPGAQDALRRFLADLATSEPPLG